MLPQRLPHFQHKTPPRHPAVRHTLLWGRFRIGDLGFKICLCACVVCTRTGWFRLRAVPVSAACLPRRSPQGVDGSRHVTPPCLPRRSFSGDGSIANPNHALIASGFFSSTRSSLAAAPLGRRSSISHLLKDDSVMPSALANSLCESPKLWRSSAMLLPDWGKR